MKPQKMTPAQSYNGFAELVCSNSLKSDLISNASGLLKEEMRRFDSLIVRAARGQRACGGPERVFRRRYTGHAGKPAYRNI
jgi:methylenetetrahydrofolate--tRNA-(uracil-5-)-methyltransferase